MPARVKQEVEGLNFSEEDLLPFDIKGTWEAMEECSRLGLCKSIGVSNFSSKKYLSFLNMQPSLLPLIRFFFSY
jgi:diketogulonate reductase-like aldo/keto reductase